MLRHREQEDLRRHTEGFKPNYMDNVSTVKSASNFSEQFVQIVVYSTNGLLFAFYSSSLNLQREQEMRGGELVPRGPANMGGRRPVVSRVAFYWFHFL